MADSDRINIVDMMDDHVPVVSRIVCDGYRWLAENEGYTDEQLARLIETRGCEESIRRQSLQYRFLVAVFGSDVLGVAAIEGNELTKLYVDIASHGLGIGSALFRAAERIIADAGYSELSLGSFASSVTFYENMGMIISEHQSCNTGPLAGRQVIVMRKQLGVQARP